jgi:hypothetical protein
MSYIPGRSREHRDYAGDPTETIDRDYRPDRD